MYINPATICLLFLCFTVITDGSSKPAQLAGDISINCGSSVNSAAINGREWLGEAQPQSSSILEIGGSSTSTVIHDKLIAGDNAVPYRTARISRSQFSYAFQVSPGPKILLLHFNPVPYKGFKGLKDLFTVEVGSFTLLGNFSASLAARAFGVNSIVKEYCLYVHENQLLNIMFSPSDSSPLQDVYAFINGIEIISVPSRLSYFHGEDTGVEAVGQKSQVYIDYNTALELVHRLNVRHSTEPSNGNFDHLLPVWITQKTGKVNNSTWRIPVDVGFKYLIRFHFSELGLQTMSSDDLMFKVFINQVIAHTNVDMGKGRDGSSISRHMDYMVMMRGHKKQIKRDFVISLHSYDALVDIDGNGLLTGFEVFKLSNPYDSLATPNPLPPSQTKPPWNIKTLLSIIGYRYAIVDVLIIAISLVNIIGYKSRILWEANCGGKQNKLSDRAQQVCRCFSLYEIQLATKNFSNSLLIGRGGFGKVYKGIIDNGKTTVAIKRLKSNSSQGAREFLAEIETLSELRHDNLVSLIGYCNGYGEMILVYDYMACGTLADHLFKLPQESDNSSSLTWKQLLNISIGAARGLDYIHTGIGVIHRDVKASNILLDENFVAKVSDFGLVKHEDKINVKSHVSTRVKGTRGYVDPHYVNTCKLTRKSDTYAFGVVLLEILCGRPAVDLRLLEDEQILIKWARKNNIEGNIYRIVCSSIRGEASENSLRAFVAVAERCLHDEPKQRPTMAQVVLQLESVLELQDSDQVSGSTDIANASEGIRDDESVNKELSMDSMYSENLKLPFREQRNAEDINTFTESFNRVRNGRSNNTFTFEISPRTEDRRNSSTSEDRRPAMHKQSRLRALNAFWYRIRPSKQNELLLSEIREADLRVPQFSWDKVVAATNNFSHRLGQGGFGSVYKGALPSGRVIAVKRQSGYSSQGDKQFKNEILVIPNLRHRNIIKLLGYCIYRKERLLIYEFMENGSLDIHLGGQHLQWPLRLKIIMGIARGVLYLHEDSGKCVLYRALKSANILLDAEMNPKLSDFDFAMTLAENESVIFASDIVGTLGYLSPEYIRDGVCSVKLDAYNFGVVVLEIIAGRRITHYLPKGECLTEIAWILWKGGRLVELVDESLVGPFPVEEALRCIQVALLCLQERPSDRPTMPYVVKMLEGNEPLLEPLAPCPRLQKDDSSGSSIVSAFDSDAIHGIEMHAARLRR